MLTVTIYICIFFLVTLASIELGYRFSQRQLEDGKSHSPVFNGAMFALLGLMLAFSFNGASARFDQRSQLAIDESIAMAQAYDKLAYFSEERQPAARARFTEYVAARVAIYDAVPDTDKAMAAFVRSREIKREFEEFVAQNLKEENDRLKNSMIAPAMGAMFSIESRRYAAINTHPPNVIFFLTFGLAMVVAFLSSIETEPGSRRPLISAFLFPLVISGVLYVILDIEYPRQGFIIADSQDYLLHELLERVR